MRRHPFAAVNLISDPIHGYIELTKRLTTAESSAAGLPDEDVAEEDLLDTAWLQRLRRISQLQSARWVFPTAEHSRFTHGLGVMHEAGLWARSLYPSLRAALVSAGEAAVPSEGLVTETMRLAGLLHDVGHGPFAHFFDDHVLSAFEAPADPRRPDAKRLTHEDLSGAIIGELGELLRGLRRAPGAVAERDALRDDEAIDPAWVAFLIAKPALSDPSMPRWVRWLAPLLSGVFTVDNLDYVRRDAYLTGVTAGPVDVERLRRYTFIGSDGLTLYEPGLGALEMFLSSRRFMYQQVYFHRTVRAIDLDLAGVFGPSIVIGGAIGGAVGIITNTLFPQIGVNPGAFVIVGMAGFFSAAAHCPISTIIMLRSIGDVARSEGEDLADPESALACLQVFALGTRDGETNAAESGYFAARGLLAKSVAEAARFIAERGVLAEGAPVLVRFIAQIASRFGVVVTQKLAAQAVPVIGALGGAAVNYAFIDHFQDVARAHFVVRRLERRYGKNAVRVAYEQFCCETEAAA